MKFFKEFGAFVKRGNVMDLAIGMVIGSAFNKIVSSLVNDIVMPLLGAVLRVNVQDLNVVLVEAVTDPTTGEIITEAVTLKYGNFIQTVIDFFIIALSVFVAMRAIIQTNKRIKEAAEMIKDKIIDDEEEQKAE